MKRKIQSQITEILKKDSMDDDYFGNFKYDGNLKYDSNFDLQEKFERYIPRSKSWSANEKVFSGNSR